MHAQLLIIPGMSSCERAVEIWQYACREAGWTLEVIDIQQPRGESVSQKLSVKSLPCLLIRNQAVAVGVPDLDSATTLLNQHTSTD